MNRGVKSRTLPHILLVSALFLACTMTADAQMFTGTGQGTGTGTTGRAGIGQGAGAGSVGLGSALGGPGGLGGLGTGAGQMFGAVQQGLGGMFGAVTGTATTTTATSNPFNAYYANPLAAGLAGGSPTIGGSRTAGGRTSGGFGTPLHPVTALPTTTGFPAGTTGTAPLLRGGLSGTTTPGVASISVQPGLGIVSTTQGTRRSPAVTIVPDFAVKPVDTGALQAELQGVIERSSSLESAAIRVTVTSQEVVLRGQVPEDRQRRLAEALVRLSPGVRAVRNELEVLEPLPLPRSEP